MSDLGLHRNTMTLTALPIRITTWLQRGVPSSSWGVTNSAVTRPLTVASVT
jgi:hypothetical protein